MSSYDLHEYLDACIDSHTLRVFLLEEPDTDWSRFDGYLLTDKLDDLLGLKAGGGDFLNEDSDSSSSVDGSEDDAVVHVDDEMLDYLQDEVAEEKRRIYGLTNLEMLNSV